MRNTDSTSSGRKARIVRRSLIRSSVAVTIIFLATFAAGLKLAVGYSDTALQTIGICGALLSGIGLLLAAIMGWSILRSSATEECIEFRYPSRLDRTFRSVLALGGLVFDAESGPNVYRYRVLLR